jgi:uncharacterized protein YutE (UPF0331/DUF86 family)
MIFEKEQIEDIVQRIDFIRIQIKDLEQFNNLDWKIYSIDRNVQRNVERLAENVANAAIDISKIVLAGEDVEMPNSYKDIILKLADVGIFNSQLAARIADYAALRNILAHQYLDLKWDKIKFFIKNAALDFDSFITAISKKIRI